MSKLRDLLNNAEDEFIRVGENPEIMGAYRDVLRSLATIENQTEEEKLSILRTLIYGKKFADMDVEPTPPETEKFCDCCGPTPFTPDFIIIGDECFAMGDKSYISYKGEYYYRACNQFVADRVDGGVEFCVKRVGHPGSEHESYSGIVLRHFDGPIDAEKENI